MSDVILELKDAAFRHSISSRSLSKPFGKTQGSGIFSINLKLHRGQILGLVGPNGAGKTTLMRILAGIYPIQKGEIMYYDSKSSKQSSISEIKLRTIVGHMPEQVRWQGKTTVKRTLEDIAEMRGVAYRVDGILNMVGLSEMKNSLLDQLSQGMRQRLTLATALLGSPQILLLDEPFNGLDPVAIRAFEKLLGELAMKGVSIIISSHRVAGMVHLVDRLALLHKGQLLIEGTLDDIENEFGLDDRIEIEGLGEMPDFGTLFSDSISILESQSLEHGWKIVVRNKSGNLLKQLVSSNIEISTWKAKDTDIVEMLCAATGLDLDEIGFGVVSSTMMPYRNRGEEE
jgi:ABC-type multidrug transport system ATPase subunit